MLCKQILMSMGCYFPEVRAFGTLVTSTKVFRLQNSLTMPPPLTNPYLECLDFVPRLITKYN